MVVPTLEPAGMETLVVELSIRLVRLGHSVAVTCIHGEGILAERLVNEGIEISLLPIPGFLPNLFPCAMIRHLREKRPDILHSHSGAWQKSSFPAWAAGVPGVVHTVHGLHDRERWQDVLLMHSASVFTQKVVSVSEPLEEYLKWRVGVPSEKVRTILNGVDTERFYPGGASLGLKMKLGLPPDSFLVGSVARFSPVKDHGTLLRGFALVTKRHPNIHLALIGKGELEDDLRFLRKELCLEDRVHFLGLLPDPAPAYRDLDLFVLTSMAEGTSISILEAMSSGVPVLATDVGGNPALLAEGASGCLVPPRDPERLAQAILELSEDEECRRRLASEGRILTEHRFSLDLMVEKYLNVYACLLRL